MSQDVQISKNAGKQGRDGSI